MAPSRNGQRRSLTDLLAGDDRPLTTTELADMIGMSPTFVRSEIRTGNLKAASLGNGRKRVFRIAAREARSYASKLGLA